MSAPMLMTLASEQQEDHAYSNAGGKCVRKIGGQTAAGHETDPRADFLDTRHQRLHNVIVHRRPKPN